MLNFSSKDQRKYEEELYGIVVNEIERNEINKALWARALSDSDNNENKTRGLYIKYRVQKLKDEISDKREVEYKNKKAEKAVSDMLKKSEQSVVLISKRSKDMINDLRWFAPLIMIIGTSGIFLSVFGNTSNEIDASWIMFSVSGIVVGAYLFFQRIKISKTKDFNSIKKILNGFYMLLIIVFATLTIISFSIPFLAFIFSLITLRVLIRVVRFNKAFNFAKSNNLI